MRAAVLIDSGGRLLAHAGTVSSEAARRLGELAGELVETAELAATKHGIGLSQVELSTADGMVFALRGRSSGSVIATLAERQSLPALIFTDMRYAEAGMLEVVR